MFLMLVYAAMIPLGSAAVAQPLPVGAPMHFTIGNDVKFQVQSPEKARAAFERIAAGAAKARVTAFEPYVKWMLLEPDPGQWDFSYYDMQLAIYGQYGIKWVPFLITGPAYATPMWFKESPESLFAVCLEHGKATRSQSIWNPHMRTRVPTVIKQFAAHFPAESIQSLLLGISGDFGETIYTVSGNYWTYIWDGEYHQHLGWWCGDTFARADFVREMRQRYGDVAALNRAWGTRLGRFEEVEPFVPTPEHNRRARLDMIDWYRGSMTDYAAFWLEAVREVMPDVNLLLCTGGSGLPAIGADFSEQAVMAAKYDAGIRITNEASNYAQNYVLTRWVGTACRNLGTYFGYEPAGPVDEHGIVARIYNAVASGADELFVYDNPPQDERGAIYARYRDLLIKRQPRVDVALFLAKTSWDLGLNNAYFGQGMALRDYVDFDMLDETMLREGFLDRYKVLLWLGGPVTEADDLERITAWVRKGGKLFCAVEPETVEGQPWRDRLAGLAGVTFLERPSSQPGKGAADTRPAVESAPDRSGEVPADVLTAWLEQIARAVPAVFPDGRADGVYCTRMTDGSMLILNFTDQQVERAGLRIGPFAIGEHKPGM